MSSKLVHIALFVSALCFAACTPAEEDLSDAPRGSVAKADHVVGTCAGACSSKSSGGTCWCDDLCDGYGDCCEDAGELCGVDECTDSGSGCHDGDSCEIGWPNLCVAPTAPTTCGPEDAAGVGACEAFFGYAWNGLDCVGLSGCSCEGADCGAWSSLADCQTAHTACLPGADCPDPADPKIEYKTYDPGTCAAILFTCPDGWDGFSNDCGCGCIDNTPQICGGIVAASCDDAGDFCDYGSHCGSGDQAGVCTERPGACTAQYDPVCGCDGNTYGNACNAASAGVSVEYAGECPTATTNTCQGHCGGTAEDGSCWCDSWCSYYGDCCGDKTTFCG